MFLIYDMDELDWIGVDVVLECIGKFNDGNKVVKYCECGVKKVLILVFVKNVQKIIVFGVNDELFEVNDNVIFNGLCIINCFVFFVKVLYQGIGIENGLMIMIYSYIGDQLMFDCCYFDFYCVCFVVMVMILIFIGVVKVLGEVLLDLKGKLDGIVMCVLMLNVFVVDLIFVVFKDVIVDDVNEVVCEVVESVMKGVLVYDLEFKVFIDFNYIIESLIYVFDQIKVVGGCIVCVLVWYDNEWGFFVCMVDVVVKMGQLG